MIARPELLYEDVVEVNERVVMVKPGEGTGSLGDDAVSPREGKQSVVVTPEGALMQSCNRGTVGIVCCLSRKKMVPRIKRVQQQGPHRQEGLKYNVKYVQDARYLCFLASFVHDIFSVQCCISA